MMKTEEWRREAERETYIAICIPEVRFPDLRPASRYHTSMTVAWFVLLAWKSCRVQKLSS